FLISGSAEYSVRVIDSPRDRTTSPAPFPLQAVDGAVRVDGVTMPANIEALEAAHVQPVGDALYRALTSDNRVQDIVSTTIAVAEAQGGSTRLRFQVEPKELRGLPWETLYRDPQGFLCLLPSTSITRFIAADGQPVRTLLTKPPLNVLI